MNKVLQQLILPSEEKTRVGGTKEKASELGFED